jgi:hypothetical protein
VSEHALETTPGAQASDAPAVPQPDRDGLVLLANDSMHARRRPWAIAGVWAWETAFALVVSWPAAALVRGAYGSHPRGDAALWSPGGLDLADLAVHELHAIGALAWTAIGCAAVAAIAGLWPMAALMTSIAHATRERRAPGLARVAPTAVRSFRPMLFVLVLTTIVQAALAVGAAIGTASLQSWLTPKVGEAPGQAIGAVVLVLGLLFVWGVGVAQDLARASVVRFKISGLRAFAFGWRAFWRNKRTAYWSWAWRALASWVPVAIAAFVAGCLGGCGGRSLIALAALHQLVVYARVALRASWLARALRMVDSSHMSER